MELIKICKVFILTLKQNKKRNENFEHIIGLFFVLKITNIFLFIYNTKRVVFFFFFFFFNLSTCR